MRAGKVSSELGGFFCGFLLPWGCFFSWVGRLFSSSQPPAKLMSLFFSLGTQTIQVHMEAGREVGAPICSLGEPDVVVKGRVLVDGLK